MKQNLDIFESEIFSCTKGREVAKNQNQNSASTMVDLKKRQKIEVNKDRRREKLLVDLIKARVTGADLSAVAVQAPGNPYRSLYTKAKPLFPGKYFWRDALIAAGLPTDEIMRKRHWDKELIKAALIARHKAGKPLDSTAVRNDDYSLYQAAKAKRHFISYDAALIYAGFNPKKVRVHKKGFTREEIIRKIIDLHIRGRAINHASMKIGRYRRYYDSAISRFAGGWREAVETAGIDYVQCCQRKPKKWWTKERVMELIRQRVQAGRPVNSGFVSKHQTDLYIAGSRIFDGGWQEALVASGLNPDNVRQRPISLSKEQLLAVIKDLSNQDQDLSVSVMSLSDDKYLRQIYTMAINRFGSWRQAIAVSGLSYDQIRKVRATISVRELSEIVRNLEIEGHSLRAVDFQRSDQLIWIYRMVISRFDSWKKFLDQAGIDSDKWCTITDWKNGQGVIDYLRVNFDSGIVTGGAIGNKSFALAARKYFGGIKEAVAAAGMVYTRNGSISPEQLEGEKVIGTLYSCNLEFLEQLADNVYYGARGGRRRSLEKADLVNEAFTKMLELLSEKPADQGLREFCRQPILTGLRKLNREMFREVVYGEEVYLDIFSTDDDVWS